MHNALNEFWNSWSHLSNNPESESARIQVEIRAMFCRAFSWNAFSASGLRTEINGRLYANINKVNELVKK